MKILNYKDICRQVQEIARETGKFIRNERKTLSDRDVELKGSASLVTYVDKTAERKIVEALKKIIPESGFITEEGT
ncbi:MAG: inositol monophosphatase, partial [Bacteroidales bacterium]|nr:inositol monophosphatase [Bacteroidales bacterium]